MTEKQYLENARILHRQYEEAKKQKDMQAANALLADAIALLREGTNAFPRHYRLTFTLGNYARELARNLLYEAEKALKAAISLRKNPNIPEQTQDQVKALTELGLVEQWLSRFDESEKALQRALELNNNNAHTYTILANTYKLNGQYVKALSLLQKAKNLFKSDKNRFERYIKIENEIMKTTKAVTEASKIRDLISAAKTAEALDHFEKYFQRINDPESLNDVVALKNRLTRTETEIKRGIIYKQEADVEIQRINMAILDLIQHL